MEPQEKMDFDAENRRILRELVDRASQAQDDISGSVIATIAQFIINTRRTLSKKAQQDNGSKWISAVDILEAQIEELRHCVLDLCAYKEHLTKGVKSQ